MKQSCILFVFITAGCRAAQPTPLLSSDEQLLPGFIYGPGQFPKRGCDGLATGVPFSTQVSTSATLYVGTVKADDIKIQTVKGVNAVRMLEALKAAVPRTGYSLDESKPQSIIRDQITIHLVPVPRGEYVYTHQIIAKIQPGANEVSIEISSEAFRDEGGQRKYYKAPDGIPQGVFQLLSAALMKPGG